jgi:hypothetical protein
MVHPQPIQLAHVFSTEVFEEIPAHQFVSERHENPLLHLLAADGQAIRASAAGSRAEAGQAMAPVHDFTAAFGAFRQTGEEIPGTPGLVESLWIAARCHAAHLDLPRLHLAPQLVLHDS